MPQALILRLLVAAVLVLGVAQAACANPFAPGSKPAGNEETSSTAGLGLGARIVALQREVNRALTQRMEDAKTGQPKALLIGAALCFLYGVFHAAGPGHGKVVTMSYFLGRDAKAWRGVMMGGQVALTHVGGAIALAVVASLLMQGAASPSLEDLRWVKLLSYAAVTGIGLWLLQDRLRGGHAGECTVDHGHGHDHHHDHHDHLGHHHGHDHGARGGMVAAIVAGAVPCTGAVLVLLYCIANGAPLIGLGFVLLIGLGMAITLAAFGLVGMFARRRALAFAGGGGLAAGDARASRWRRGLDLLGPSLIVLVGLWLFIDAW